MRILVACEDTHRAYGDALVKAIRSAYPRLKVLEVAGPKELQAQVALFDPHLLISISHTVPLANGHGRLSWVELCVDPNRPSIICIDGQRWESLNPPLRELFDVLEQTESILLPERQPQRPEKEPANKGVFGSAFS